MQGSAFFREFGPVSRTAPPPGQVVALTDDAYARGVADGLAQAHAQTAARTASALEDLTARLDDMTAERDRVADETAAEAGAALAAVVRSLCPSLSALGLADRARHLLETELLSGPRPVTIRAAPDVAEALDGMGADLTVESDGDMPGTRLDLSWPEGGATLDIEALSAQIMGLADTLGPDSDPLPKEDPVPENDSMEENPHD